MIRLKNRAGTSLDLFVCDPASNDLPPHPATLGPKQADISRPREIGIIHDDDERLSAADRRIESAEAHHRRRERILFAGRVYKRPVIDRPLNQKETPHDNP